MGYPETLHLFCRVVDNFGDAGVCWRLARQLASEHGIRVTLWIDDLRSLKRLFSRLDATLDRQFAASVEVRRWQDPSDHVESHDIPDVVIEAFACELPHAYVDAMAKKEIKPAWINLEYLSAENWVEGCHRLASPHPSLPLIKHFFFPGFTGRTGGLILEEGLFEKRAAFQRNPEEADNFLASLGVAVPPGSVIISLFCYPHAPVAELLDTLSVSSKSVLCLVPEGVAGKAVGDFLKQPAKAGVSATQGNATVQVLPFVDQDDYDRLLWSCDLNFVRGEDSFVRAQWAARPFVWHIYPQDEDTHAIKLNAFLTLYSESLDNRHADVMQDFWQDWNAMPSRKGSVASAWNRFIPIMPDLAQAGPEWANRLAAHGGLAANLIEFVRTLR